MARDAASGVLDLGRENDGAIRLAAILDLSVAERGRAEIEELVRIAREQVCPDPRATRGSHGPRHAPRVKTKPAIHSKYHIARNGFFDRTLPFGLSEAAMTEKKGNGSATAKKANAKASKEGKTNPRKSSSAQAELGKKGGKTGSKSR